MPFYGPFTLGEVQRPAAERRFREQVPDISAFSMDMPRNTLGFTSGTAGLFGAGPVPSTFGAAIGAFPQSTNPLGLSPAAGMFEGTSAWPESLSGRIDAGGETGGPPGAPPGAGTFGGIPAGLTGPATSGIGLSGFGQAVGNAVSGLAGIANNTTAANVAQGLGLPGFVGNLAVSLLGSPVLSGLNALSPALNAQLQNQMMVAMPMVRQMEAQEQGPPPVAMSEEETSFQEAAQAQGQPAAPPAEEGPATTGLGLGPPGEAEGAAAAASAASAEGPADCRLATWTMRQMGVSAAHPAWRFWNGTFSPDWHGERTRERLVWHAAYRRAAKRLIAALDTLPTAERATHAARMAPDLVRPFEDGEGLSPKAGALALWAWVERLSETLGLALPRRSPTLEDLAR